MYKNKKILGIIPARGGSKGVPRKNARKVCGKPLIAWTIEAALKSRYLDKLIVSTDDSQIADIARKCGASVPFIRPEGLAGDTTPMVDVIFHAIDFLKKADKEFEIIVLLQPTSPLRTTADIDNAVEKLFAKDAKAIVSICEAERPPYWSNTLPADGSLKDFINHRIENKNRQELPTFYRLNGAVYVSYIDYLKKTGGFFGGKTFSYIMPAERSIDIDNEIDVKVAEVLLGSAR